MCIILHVIQIKLQIQVLNLLQYIFKIVYRDLLQVCDGRGHMAYICPTPNDPGKMLYNQILPS